MNKKIVIRLATAVAAVTIGAFFIIDPSKYFNPKKRDLSLWEIANGFETPTLQTKDRQLLDPCGQIIILKGVNKLSIFDDGDTTGATYFREIAQSGANCVRIGWGITHNGMATPVARLDSLISNARDNGLIPIICLFDYSDEGDGGFSHLLTDYMNYWIRPDVVALIEKHHKYLIVNIANEAATGDEDTPADVTAYADSIKKAVSALRHAGIRVPLMIDGMDRGKSLKCFALKGPEILNADSRRNLIFSFHPYWRKSFTDSLPNKALITTRFAEIHKLNITVVMGELAGYGAPQTDPNINICSEKGKVDYLQFAQQAEQDSIGWLMWEWGPGDSWRNPGDCPQLNMTNNGTYQSIKDITPGSPNWWVHDLAIDRPFGLKSAKKTPFITNGFKTCL